MKKFNVLCCYVPGIVRLNPDGTLDTNFLPQGASLSVTSIELLDSNYAIVAGGFFGISYLINPYIAKIIL
ncbi:MAG: delta-60 repeat domain-containing protein [Spirochaetota bacterium]